MKKNLFKLFMFLVIFIILFLLVFKFFWLEKNPITYFYKEPKNSLDIVYIGSSNAYSSFNTTLAYNEYGFTTGMLSYNSQPFPAAEYLIKESEKYQTPSLYIVDLSKMADNFSDIKEPAIRRVTDSMKRSDNRTDTINKLLSYTNIPKSEYINYYYSFLAYHDAWKAPGNIMINLLGNKELYKGYVLAPKTIKKIQFEEYIWPESESKLDKQNIDAIISLINYIKNNNLNVLFVLPKRVYTDYDNELEKLNYGMRIIQDNGFEVINFNKLSDFQISSTDFFNDEHYNAWGATKYTLFFSRYLKEHYDLKDHRGDNKYITWNTEYNRLKKDFNKLTGENFDDILQKDKKLFK